MIPESFLIACLALPALPQNGKIEYKMLCDLVRRQSPNAEVVLINRREKLIGENTEWTIYVFDDLAVWLRHRPRILTFVRRAA